MNNLLATGSAPATFAAWLACLAFFAMLCNHLGRLGKLLTGRDDEVRVRPWPLQVKGVPEVVLEKDCKERHGAMIGAVEKLSTAREADVCALHEKINGVALDVSGLKAAMELLSQRLAGMDAKLDRSLEKQILHRTGRP
jgi:hypothetical protein